MSLILPRRRTDVLRDPDNARLTLRELVRGGPWVPEHPIWRERTLTHGWCRYTRRQGRVFRLEVDLEPDGETPFVALLRHCPDEPHTRMHVPWDVLLYETFATTAERDAWAEALELEAHHDRRRLRSVAHPEGAL